DPFDPNRVEEVFGLLGQGSKTVQESGLKLLQGLPVLDLIELGIEVQAFGDIVDVTVREEQFKIGIQLQFLHIDLFLLSLHFLIELPELIFLELLNGLRQYFLVGLKADLIDKTTLFPAQKVPGAPDFKVFHGDVEPTAQLGELFQGLDALSGIGGHRLVGGGDEITEGLFIAPSHPAPHLVQVAQAKVVGVVDENGIGIGDIQATFHYGGGDQYVKLPIDEGKHELFQFLAFQLSMADPDLGIGKQALDHPGHFLDVLDAVVDEEYLSAPLDLVGNGIPYEFLIEADHLALYGIPVGWGSVDHREVPGRHQTELQGPWDGGGRKGEHVHILLDRAQLFLDRNPEL